MDLIDRAAAIEEVDYTVTSVSVCATVEQARGATWAKGRIRERLEKMPTVDAVPLDKLCEWLAENAEFPMEVEVKIFYEPTEEPEIKLNRMPNDAERWREKLTKWMEEQDAAD